VAHRDDVPSPRGKLGIDRFFVELGISRDPPAILKNYAPGNANNNSGHVRHILQPHHAGLRYGGSCPRLMFFKTLAPIPKDGVVADCGVVCALLLAGVGLL